MTHRDRQESDEGGIRIAHARADVALDGDSADRIGAIEHDHAFPGARGVAHQDRRRRDIRVIAGADVLQIDQHHVDGIEGGSRRATRSAIETVDWEAGSRIPAVGQSGTIFRSPKSVLGTE